jgi:molecular chaperone DnaK (HSP70)
MSSIKESLQKKIESQINAWEKEIESLKVESEKELARSNEKEADAELKREFADRINALKSNIDQAQGKLSEVEGATESKLEQIMSDIKGWFD